jgi:hypothetical protein
MLAARYASRYKHAIAGALLAGLLANAPAADHPGTAEHPSTKRGFDVPPSADLLYSIKARQSGMALSGDAVINWRAGDQQYAITAETRTPLLGKILDNKSAGAVDDYGLAPAQFYEKRLFKDARTTSFRRDSKTIVFSDSQQSYPIKGGEQDRASVQWQLIAVARAAPDKFTPGSQWDFFVAGQRDAERWVFKVVKRDTVHTAMGELDTVHLVKSPPPDAKGQQLDIWLAPKLGWFPVRLRFDDGDGDFVEQTLEKFSLVK